MRRFLDFSYTKRKLVPIKGILVLVVIGLAFYLIKNRFLIVTQIICQKNESNCQPRHLDVLNQYQNSFILFIKPLEIQKQLLVDPSLKEAIVKVTLPNKLEVKLTEELLLIPVGVVPISSNSLVATDIASESADIRQTELSWLVYKPENYYLLNSSGNLIPSEPIETKITLFTDETPPSNLLITLFKLHQELRNNGYKPVKFWFSGKHAGVELDSRLIIFFNLETEIMSSLASLQQILSQTTINDSLSLQDSTPIYVDLRFKNPVIVNQTINE